MFLEIEIWPVKGFALEVTDFASGISALPRPPSSRIISPRKVASMHFRKAFFTTANQIGKVVIATKARRCFVAELVISSILALVGMYLLLPKAADYISYTAQYSFRFGTGGQVHLNSISLFHFYYSNKSKFNLYVYPAGTIEQEGYLFFDFPSHIEIDPSPFKYETVSAHRVNSGTTGTLYVNMHPTSNYHEVYTFLFETEEMHFISDDWKFAYINPEYQGNIDFPISYFFFPPAISNCVFTGSFPIQKDRAYVWTDIRKGFINDPTMIKVSTPALVRRSQIRLLTGTIFLTLGLSYLTNLLYGYFRTRK
jgi:hypothetical protein